MGAFVLYFMFKLSIRYFFIIAFIGDSIMIGFGLKKTMATRMKAKTIK
jgi:hypothetical protein